MSTHEEETTHAVDNSLSMRFVVRSLKGKWPSVRCLKTDTLAGWMAGGPKGGDPDAGSGSGSGASQGEVSTRQTDGCPQNPGMIHVLDARPEEEYCVSHIQQAQRVDPDLHDLTSVIQQLQLNQTEPQTVVCYCSIGYRSSKYAQALTDQLQKEEYQAVRSNTSIYNLEGSLFKWANEGRPMVDHKDRPTHYAHPFSVIWGKILKKEHRRSIPDP